MRVLLIALSILSLAACSSTSTEQVATPRNNKAVNLGHGTTVKEVLLKQYREWKGAKYQLGGLSKKGIDCSGFVYLTFQQKLGTNLPRSTALQANIGKSVSRKQLKTGDLIFFKTGAKVRHVGIYISDGNFLHASTKRGVMISSLSHAYWKTKYWKSQRIHS